MENRRHRCRASARRTLAFVIAGALASGARAEDTRSAAGITFSPDGDRVLINREVGDERWAITRNAEDGTLTGNVFHVDGRDPQFVWCLPTSAVEDPDPSRARYGYDCYGTTSCDEASCPDWSFVSAVTLNGRFFLPPGDASPRPAPSPTPRPVASPTRSPAPSTTPARSSTPSGTSTPSATATASRTSTPAPVPTPTRGPLVITPDKATVAPGASFLFVITGGQPPYSVFVSSGGTVTPATVASAGAPFTFTASPAAGSGTIIVVDQAQALETAPVTVK